MFHSFILVNAVCGAVQTMGQQEGDAVQYAPNYAVQSQYVPQGGSSAAPGRAPLPAGGAHTAVQGGVSAQLSAAAPPAYAPGTAYHAYPSAGYQQQYQQSAHVVVNPAHAGAVVYTAPTAPTGQVGEKVMRLFVWTTVLMCVRSMAEALLILCPRVCAGRPFSCMMNAAHGGIRYRYAGGVCCSLPY